MHTTHDGRIVLNGLEVNSQVEISNKNAAQEEKHISRSGPDDTMGQHGERHHGPVSLVVLPDQKQSKCDSGANQEADND